MVIEIESGDEEGRTISRRARLPDHRNGAYTADSAFFSQHACRLHVAGPYKTGSLHIDAHACTRPQPGLGAPRPRSRSLLGNSSSNGPSSRNAIGLDPSLPQANCIDTATEADGARRPADRPPGSASRTATEMAGYGQKLPEDEAIVVDDVGWADGRVPSGAYVKLNSRRLGRDRHGAQECGTARS